ncbi:MAG: SpoIIE family protein phosphatase [Candidatus Omnitrophica bacterium]|nr:SpoIIE family protein phosphatase [Candidatus Omnitrophota bacterium]
MKDQRYLLIVDDEPDIRFILGDYLKNNGFIPILAENGREALTLLNHVSPDVIISDILMPEMDGLEFLQEIQRRGLEIPVILMTAYATIDRAVEAMKSGAADFITKPLKLNYLIQVIRRVCKQFELERLVLEQEQQLKADLRLASLVQRCMLPADVENKHFGFYLRYEPLLEIGGDSIATRLYSEEMIAVALYDVTGHGVSAALLASLLHHELTDLLAQPIRPLDIIRQINLFASEKFSATGLFCTMALIWLDTNRMTLTAVNAGHPSILLWKNESREFEAVSSHMPPIGLLSEDDFKTDLSCLSLSPKDRILLYTDGFTESRQKNGDILGEDRFVQIVQTCIQSSPRECMDRIFQEAAQSRQGNPRDDLTLVLLEVK